MPPFRLWRDHGPTPSSSSLACRPHGVAELALSYRIPAVCAWQEFAHDGGLAAYFSAEGEMYRRAAVFVDKILKGAKPAELPVEQPTKFELVINLKTAKARPRRAADAARPRRRGDRIDSRPSILYVLRTTYGTKPTSRHGCRMSAFSGKSRNLMLAPSFSGYDPSET